MLVSMKGSMPKEGVAAVEAQVLLKRNGTRPILRIAGIPDITRYTVMSRTQPTVIRPSTRNMLCITNSSIFPILLFFFILRILSQGL